MTRIQAFQGYATHAWYRRLWARCTKTDLAFAETFLAQHAATEYDKFYIIVTRLGLSTDQRAHNIPPAVIASKAFPLICEMMSAANEAAHQAQKKKK